MRSLTLGEVIDLHQRVIEETGGAVGVRDLSALKAAVSLPRVTFDGRDLYPSIVEKAAALCFSLVMNHPFLDGNKRTAHAALEVTLVLNGLELSAPIDEQEEVFLALAGGSLRRSEFVAWVRSRVEAL